MKTVQTTTTYLQMLEPPEQRLDSPQGVAVAQDVRLSGEAYRDLYRAVGGSFHWIDRLLISQDQLESIIHHQQVTVCRLEVDGRSAGFCELDRRTDREIEIAYFGLVSNYLGRGLGKYFLNWTINKAWSYGPRRVWLHTCDLDHQAALPNYLKAGFEVFDTKIVQQSIAADSSLGEES